MARAAPPERCRCSRETTTGAATARLVVKTDAARAVVSDTTSARSSAWLALMPAATPAARNPRAEVTPPVVVGATAGMSISGKGRRGRVDAVAALGVEDRVERHDHAVLPAATEQRALHAVGKDLLEQPRMRNDREAHAAEIAGPVRERAELFESGATRPPPPFLDNHHAYAGAARGEVDRQRSHFRHVRTERRQLRAAHDRAAPDRDHETAGMHGQFAERTRQEVALFEVRLNEGENLLGVLRVSGAQGDSNGARGFSRAAGGTSGHAEAPTAPIASSRRPSASMASASLMTRGGSRRTTRSAVRLTTMPRSSAAGTTAAASRVSSSPHMSPAPRTSLTIGCADAIARRRRSNDGPTRLTFSATPPSNSSPRTNSAARHASRLPP